MFTDCNRIPIYIRRDYAVYNCPSDVSTDHCRPRPGIIKSWHRLIAEEVAGVVAISVKVDKGAKADKASYNGSVLGVLFWD